jgi:hypothetical protein
MVRGDRQERQVAGALDGLGDFPLVLRTITGDAAGNDLAALRYKVTEGTGFFVINSQVLFGAETANLPALERTPLAGAAGAA